MNDVRRMVLAPLQETTSSFLLYATHILTNSCWKCRLHESGRQWYYVTTALIELARCQDFDVVVGERSEMSSAKRNENAKKIMEATKRCLSLSSSLSGIPSKEVSSDRAGRLPLFDLLCNATYRLLDCSSSRYEPLQGNCKKYTSFYNISCF